MYKRTIFSFLLLASLSGCVKQSGPAIKDLRNAHANRDVKSLHERVELPECPLTLLDIIAIARDLNLDLLVKQLDWIIQEEAATGTSLKMLPGFTHNKLVSYRDKNTASTQLTLSTGVTSPPAISSTKKTYQSDWTATWNLLDFGLAYYQSRAEMDRAQVQRFQYEKLKQNVILDIYRSYWKGIAAKATAERSREIIALSIDVESKIKKQTQNQVIPATQGLQTESQLLTIQQNLNFYEEVYFEAKAELAALMGLPADTCFELADVELSEMPELLSISEIEEIAINKRPELYGSDFEQKATLNLAHAEILQMFPSFNLFSGSHKDRNPYLVHHHWILTGFQTAWNLISIPQRWATVTAANDRYLQAYESRLALSIGVLSQVNIAYWRYQEVLKKYLLQREIYDVLRQLANATKKQQLYGTIGIVEVVQTEGAAIQSETVLMQQYGDLQIALEQLNNSMGWPLFFNTIEPEQIVETDQETAENIDYE